MHLVYLDNSHTLALTFRLTTCAVSFVFLGHRFLEVLQPWELLQISATAPSRADTENLAPLTPTTLCHQHFTYPGLGIMSRYQFTAGDADIILRTTRCAVPHEFRVHKTILSIASPVFKDMFDIPQPILPKTLAGVTIPVIDLDDTPEDLYNFLRMIYPFGYPATPTLDAISRALVIFDKYQVLGASLCPLRSLLVSPSFLKSDPVRVYSIACSWKFKEEADLAAPYTTSCDILASIREEDVRRMTSMEYHRILILGRERQSKGQNYIRNVPVVCSGCHNYKRFYAEFRQRLSEDFSVDYKTFYDRGQCVLRCFEIAMEIEEEMGPTGCGGGRDSHLGTFIYFLADRLSGQYEGH